MDDVKNFTPLTALKWHRTRATCRAFTSDGSRDFTARRDDMARKKQFLSSGFGASLLESNHADGTSANSQTASPPCAFPRVAITQWCHRAGLPGLATPAARGGRGRRSRDRTAGWGRGRAPAAAPGRRRRTGGGPGWGESRPCWSTPAETGRRF